MAIKGYRSRIMHFRDEITGSPEASMVYYDDGVLLTEGDKIHYVGKAATIEREGFNLALCEHLPDCLILSGFIDTHIHSPQLDVIGCYGKQLMEWLGKYTFPAEIRFANEAYCAEQTQRFVSTLLANGTTSAMVFTTSFKHSTEQLFQQTHDINMRLIAGKIMMDRNAPNALLDTPQQAKIDSETLIRRWHGKSRLGYALTPRFAGTSTPEQLKTIGAMMLEYPDLWLQTHLSESMHEITWTQELFPKAKDYLHTYEIYGLVGPKTNFAHCIYLSEDEITRIADHGSSISFCPSSNLFLGSGLFDLAKITAHNIPVSLATDVGAGTSPSLFKTMGDAYKVCQLQGVSLGAEQAFYLASLGAARALKIDNYVGSLASGKEADFIILNPKNSAFISQRLKQCTNIEEELFVYMTMGDERLIERTYLAGTLRYQSGDTI